MNKPTKKILALSYFLVFCISILLITIPLALGWAKAGIGMTIFFGAAASLLAALTLALLMAWANKAQWSIVTASLAQQVADIVNNRDSVIASGLVTIYSNRNDSLSTQNTILKGRELFVFAVSLNSLLSYRTTAAKIISERLDSDDFKLQILLVNPLYYANKSDIQDGKDNAIKLLRKTEELHKLFLSNKNAFNKTIKIKLIDRDPCYFIIGNEERLLISFYDYEAGGAQPVFEFSNIGRDTAMYKHYRDQFNTIFNGHETHSKQIEELKNMLEEYTTQTMKQ